MLKLFDKITLIERALKKGSQSDEMLYDFSIELRQIKQLLKEMQVSEKPTPRQGPGKEFNFQDSLANVRFV